MGELNDRVVEEESNVARLSSRLQIAEASIARLTQQLAQLGGRNHVSSAVAVRPLYKRGDKVEVTNFTDPEERFGEVTSYKASNGHVKFVFIRIDGKKGRPSWRKKQHIRHVRRFNHC